MKKAKRAAEKARMAYGGDFSMIKDCFRVSIVGDAPRQALAAAAALLAPASKVKVLRIKNRLSRKYDAELLSAGYRDVQLVATIPGGSGLLVEVQVHLRPFYEHKSRAGKAADASGQTGHQRYIAWRERREREKYKFTEQLRASGAGAGQGARSVGSTRGTVGGKGAAAKGKPAYADVDDDGGGGRRPAYAEMPPADLPGAGPKGRGSSPEYAAVLPFAASGIGRADEDQFC